MALFDFQAEGLGQYLSQPFRLPEQTHLEPRALPWARLSDPFGVKTSDYCHGRGSPGVLPPMLRPAGGVAMMAA
jgi:hypothetical protein